MLLRQIYLSGFLCPLNIKSAVKVVISSTCNRLVTALTTLHSLFHLDSFASTVWPRSLLALYQRHRLCLRVKMGNLLHAFKENKLWVEYFGEGNGTPLQYSCLENPMDGGAWCASVHGVTKSRTWLSDFTFPFHFHALEKEMATHSSVLAWRIPGTGEPGGLPSMGSHGVGNDWSDLAAATAASKDG